MSSIASLLGGEAAPAGSLLSRAAAGTGKAGDRIVSALNGEARVATPDECNHFNVLGRLIKDKYNEDTALTECVIGVK